MRTWGGSFDTSFRNWVMSGMMRGINAWTSDGVVAGGSDPGLGCQRLSLQTPW